MTREEAIRIIETVFQDEYVYKYYDSITHQALDMAIEALKQVTGKLKKTDDSLLTADPEACKEQKSKLDLISRQAAIDAVFSLCEDCDSGYCGSCSVNYPGEKDVIKVIRNLPSAQPERKKGNEKCSNKLPCGWCSLFDTPCFGRGGEQDG